MFALGLATACTSHSEPADSRPAPSTPATASNAPADEAGSDSKKLLESATGVSLDPATGTLGVPGSGYGKLRPDISNTLAGVGGLRRVTFAFTCTGTSKVKIQVVVNGKPLPAPGHEGQYACGSAVLQEPVDVPSGGTVGFDAHVSGGAPGTFAYAYFNPDATAK
jgi:hypothetical protein